MRINHTHKGTRQAITLAGSIHPICVMLLLVVYPTAYHTHLMYPRSTNLLNLDLIVLRVRTLNHPRIAVQSHIMPRPLIGLPLRDLEQPIHSTGVNWIVVH